jgi:small-conductance mechanosensitive channel
MIRDSTTALLAAEKESSGLAAFYEANSEIILIILTIALVSAVTWILVRAARRLTMRVLSKAQARLDRAEAGTATQHGAQQVVRRVRTMNSLITNVIVWVQVAIAAAIILAILGVNVTAIFASAGVIAAALTFSAQALLKDILTGVFLIAEDQLDVGDVVDVGFGAGVVESVSLRVTQVRAFDGYLWTVRNGEIEHLANRSRGWVRMILELDFAPESDLDHAKEVVLTALAGAVATHAAPHEIQAPPSYWGVSGLSGYGFRLKFLVEYSASAFDRLDAGMREAAYRAIIADPKLQLALGPIDSPIASTTSIASTSEKQGGK